MKLKHLESELQSLSVFHSPKIHLEQYPTSPHIASRLLYTAYEEYQDIESASIVDLGVGCGVLSAGAALLNSAHVIGIDCDIDALLQSNLNFISKDINVDLLLLNLKEVNTLDRLECDTVIMNPPFGTRDNGIDVLFLEVASRISNNAIYSLHKTTTRSHILKSAKRFGFEGKVVAELNYDLPLTYVFQRKKSVDIQVDFIRFQKMDQ